MDIHATKFPAPHLSYIRDPRYPTVKQWLEHEAATNRSHRQATGFTPTPTTSYTLPTEPRKIEGPVRFVGVASNGGVMFQETGK